MNNHGDLENTVTELAADLIRRPSLTPADAGCQMLIAERLASHGFVVEHARFGEVDNLWARHGTNGPVVVLLGHTDVVPTGPAASWRHPPFSATVDDGMLHGRGAADMKGSVAAMVVAAERFVLRYPEHAGSVAIMLTSDEEGPSVDGIRQLVRHLGERGERIDYCLVGEPSSRIRFGDAIKIGRRGTLTGELTVHGIQGHVAYPERARNPVHDAAPVLAELAAIEWDAGNAHFPPTGFQISNVHAGTGADNVIPGTAHVTFNFRFSPESTSDGLRARVREVLDRHDLDYTLDWRLGGEPFVTEPGRLTGIVQAAVERETGVRPDLATDGGTSDGRFIAPTGAQVVEFGPLNATIHQVDECIATRDLASMAAISVHVLERLLADG